MDFKKAYDFIHWESLVKIHRELKFPKTLINLVETNINKIKTRKISLQSIKKKWHFWDILNKRCTFSSTKLNHLTLEKILKEINFCKRGSLYINRQLVS